MIPEALVVLAAGAAGGLVYARSRRAELYRSLERRVGHIAAATRIDTGDALQRQLPPFDDCLVRISGIFPDATIQELRRQAMQLVRPERSYVPAHKKGGTVAYESLFEAAPAIIALYHSRAMRDLVSRIVGIDVAPTPINDQSSLSVLFYEKPGDHIGWHYDHNFYRGRHFTVLLPIINEGRAAGGLSHATLKAAIGGMETDIATPPNTLIVFEGACVNHKVTPIIDGERRLVISMTYCSDARANAAQGALRRIKDVAFFGPRALWT
ncbi:MAG: 2OG-Fe(II) oxygenase [Hyphomicrobiaceae bacterium]